MENLKDIISNLTLEKVVKIVLVVVVMASLLLNAVFLYKQYKADQTPTQVNSPNIVLDTNGKLTIPTGSQAVKVADKQVVTHEIQYVHKNIDPATGLQEKTDVELNTAKDDVYVKVNGKEHKIQPTVEESQKFENGKLVVEEKRTASIEIDAPTQSKWTATYLRGQDGRQGFGVGYAVNKTVRVDAMDVDGNPYVGVTLSLGDLSSK